MLIPKNKTDVDGRYQRLSDSYLFITVVDEKEQLITRLKCGTPWLKQQNFLFGVFVGGGGGGGVDL